MPGVITMNPLSLSSPTSSATYVDSSPRQKASCKVHYHMNQQSTYSSSDDEVEDLRQHPTGMSPSTENNFNVPATSFISHVPEILNELNLPPDHLKELVAAQFATCEKFCNQLVSMLWELEESKRWTKVVKCTLGMVQKEHTTAQLALQTWLQYAEKTLSETTQEQTSSNYSKQKEMFCSVQAKYEDLEGLAITRGMTDQDLAVMDDNCHLMMSDDEDSYPSAGCN
ncbi:uncharacterized protein BJ212DRAFT_1475929 [Suillus subaureus]|uniref:Uncharacterized protein n=1 Tax=Suillus subaureus TaxID=48587 RepID=A0A9P7EM03_9AGAM|nr:uncharacterized protein BJ212DRAFT_1475929 [Suillus subaureus]KAG1824633.1 hypothetical protein BJ212DRAFT_1475929 [Suillus subaureus]